MYVPLPVCDTCEGAYGVWKRALNPMEQDFQEVVSHPTILGIELMSFESAASTHDC